MPQSSRVCEPGPLLAPLSPSPKGCLHPVARTESNGAVTFLSLFSGESPQQGSDSSGDKLPHPLGGEQHSWDKSQGLTTRVCESCRLRMARLGLFTLLCGLALAGARRTRPEWSWRTVPVFAETSNITGPFDDAALQTLSKFPVFVGEKVGRGMQMCWLAHVESVYGCSRNVFAHSTLNTIHPCPRVCVHFFAIGLQL